jgi:ABC-2 type transport system permease protein
VAAMLSLAAGVILIIVAYVAQLPGTAQWQTQLLLYYFNLFKQMEDFTRGAVDTRTVIFYLSLTLLFLFLTLRVVESRRWK